MKKIIAIIIVSTFFIGCNATQSSLSVESSLASQSSNTNSNSVPDNNFAYFGHWYYYPESNPEIGYLYEVEFNENGSILLVSGPVSGEYLTYSGVYVPNNNKIRYSVVSFTY